MEVKPEYFSWTAEAQEKYRVTIPDEDMFRIRQALVKGKVFSMTGASMQRVWRRNWRNCRIAFIAIRVNVAKRWQRSLTEKDRGGST
jgi:hypothetical protein